MKRMMVCGLLMSAALSGWAYTLSGTDVQNMATSTANFEDTNAAVPNYVTAPNGTQLSAAEFFYVMARWLPFQTNMYVFQGIGAAPAPSGNTTNGTVAPTDLLSACQSVDSYLASYGRLPNYITVNGNHLSPAVLDYVLARTIRFYQANGRLPNYTSILPCADPAAWSLYTPIGKAFFILGTDAQSYGLSNVVNKAAANGMKEIMVMIKGTSGTYDFSKLSGLLPLAHAQGIRVHAWIACFNDTQAYNSGLYHTVGTGWIDPADTNYRNYLINTLILPAVSNYATDGVVLDYIQYPGNANGNTTPINTFLSSVRSQINTVAPSVLLAATLVPELSVNAQYYGQDYGQMSSYLNTELVMTYTYDYSQPASWIGTVLDYILPRVASSCSVQAVLESKNGSSDKSASALTTERSTAEAHGSQVHVSYFKWPFSSTQWTSLAQ